ncbi:PD40 domain-containing protein [Microbacterium sp. BK668]|uniref:PD40 domain-containing protein n=1 Tax=Microbacterium sp. BK668 TaxID=2512118 RepID=UPI0010602DE1|nr:PD40 domain-containing protein [Microbacterium sp. BK668]TDN91366.1 WD40 repeat protein [Microbacterium sp. BK668]
MGRFVRVAALGALIASGFTAAAPSAGPAAAVQTGDEPQPYRVSPSDRGAATEPFLTSDGQRVFFTSTAGLVEGDDNGVADVFVSVAAQGSPDPFAGAPSRVSVPDGALAAPSGNGPSTQPAASADGRYVAFTSAATNLVAEGGTAGRTSIYVRDTLRGTTFRVQGGAEPDGSSYDPDLSDDGRHLVFTSEATDLAPDDVNGAPDAFAAELDANGDGSLGDIAITRFIPEASLTGGTGQARISGNGAAVVFVAHTDTLDPRSPGSESGDYVYHASRPGAGGTQAGAGPGGTEAGGDGADGTGPETIGGAPVLVGRNAHHPTIDATGDAFAYIDEDDCGGIPTVIAATRDAASYSFAVSGITGTDRRAGTVADPVISPDGARVTWTTTVPRSGADASPAALAVPVVRTQEIGWAQSQNAVTCDGPTPASIDLAQGGEPAVSASARTVAFSAPSTAGSTVFALDTRRHGGLSVSSTQGRLGSPGFLRTVDIATVPLSSLHGYASAIAQAPLEGLPVDRLPLRRVPLDRLPLDPVTPADPPGDGTSAHRLPLHRVILQRPDLPGGWPQVLAGSPFAAELIQNVDLERVLGWAADALAPGSTASEAERAAAQTIRSLTLGDVDFDGSGPDALSVASAVLGSAPLARVPVPGDGPALERWRTTVDAQGLDARVDGETALADLDAAGLDIERSGVADVPLRLLPADSTLLSYLMPSELFLSGTPLGDVDLSTFDESARLALVGDGAATGPLWSFSGAFLPGATVAELASGAPESVTLGMLLMSLLDRDSYPWEQIAAMSLDPRLAEASTAPTGCGEQPTCGRVAAFRYAFDPGPGEPARFAAPTATLTTPAGTAPVSIVVAGSGPQATLVPGSPYAGPLQIDGARTRVPLPDTAGGTVLEIRASFTATTRPGETRAVGELSSGSLAAAADLRGAAPLDAFDDAEGGSAGVAGEPPAATLAEGRVTYGWLSPRWRDLDAEGRPMEGPAQDEDYYLVDPPPPGKRLVVSTDASGGRLSLALYGRATAETPLGIPVAGPAPGMAVTEQHGPAGEPSPSGADAGTPLAGLTLVEQTVAGGDGVAQVETASTDASAGQPMVVRVTSGDRRPSSALYALRVRYLDEEPAVSCTPWAAAETDDPGVEGVSDPITPTTNTVYLFDQKRFGDTYGAAEATRVREALVSLTGDGHVGGGSVDGAVLSIDSDDDVREARAALDADPCSMQQRAGLTAAINRFVLRELGDDGTHVESVVIVGADDIIPLAPVAERTPLFSERGRADVLRRTALPDGQPCPQGAAVDPCETPLSAAARTAHILTDDPYGLATAYRSLGGHLYLPGAAVGRLVESPDQIIAAIDRFLAADGTLAADTALVSGQGAWSELPDAVTGALAWRSAVNQRMPERWSAADLERRLLPADGDPPKVVSINALGDETRMLPGAAGSPALGDGAPFLAGGHEEVAALAGSLVFGLGSHAGNNLPSAYYGGVTDWVDVFSQAGGYIGNTGYGLADEATTALGERLLSLYAGWLGVRVGETQVSVGGALSYAKQSYLGTLGLSSGYDEKALQGAVYYGIPMYTLTTPLKSELPLPPVADVSPVSTNGLTAASLSLKPRFERQQDDGGRTYYSADGGAIAVPSGQAILPAVSRVLAPQPGLVPRGVVLAGMTTQQHADPPAVARTTVGVREAQTVPPDSAFPSAFATITRQQTPAGPVDLLTMTPARVEVTEAGGGSTELFTDVTAEVTYGPDTSTDITPPLIESIELPSGRLDGIDVRASDGEGDIAAVIVLVQRQGSSTWERVDAAPEATPDGGTPPDGHWRAPAPDGAFRWMVQVVDASGNVAVDTSRGHLDVANAPAPTLADPGPEAAIGAGDRILRAVAVTDARPGERLTASTTVTDAAGTIVSLAPAAVETGPDGTTQALVDQPAPFSGSGSGSNSGSVTVTLEVCRGGACASSSFKATTPALNAAPTATVSLDADSSPVEPTGLLTASGTAADPDGDPVSVSYAWSRNGVPIAGQAGSTLALTGIAATGDVIRVTATPHDGTTGGHASSAEVLVGESVVPPPGPQITAAAITADGVYAEGGWSRTAVTVSFACTSGAPVVACPDDDVVADTAAAGRTVSGTVTDLLGRTASASVLIRVDGTPPTLAPSVEPRKVLLGEPATAEAGATDASSGVATQSCDVASTATAGPASVICRATDVAGNAAEVQVYYTVVAAPGGDGAGAADPGAAPDAGVAPDPGAVPDSGAAPDPGRTPTRGPASGADPRPAPGPRVPVGVLLPDRQPLGPLADGSAVFARGSGVPIVFRAYGADGLAIGASGFVTDVVPVLSQALAEGSTVTEPYVLPFPFVYSDAADLWLGSIPTAGLEAGRTYTYRIELADGTAFPVAFGVR